MSPLATEQHSSDHAAHQSRNAKLKTTLQQLFHSLSEEVHEELLAKLTWVEVRGGEMLFKQGQQGDSLYILITGRMKAIINASSEQEREVGEISQGECVGEMALITGEARSASIYAIRDCMLVRLSSTDFQALLSRYPEVAISISRLIINRLTYTMNHTKAPAKTFNIALVPARADIAMQPFVKQLIKGFDASSRVKHLSKSLMPDTLNVGDNPAEEVDFALHNWLTDQEMDQDCVIYEAEPVYSPWTQQCLRQADKIIIINDYKKEDALSAIEEEVFLNKNKKYPQSRELVVLYPEDAHMPDHTHQLLSKREVTRHYNIRLNDKQHMQRLARMVMDKGIGLVLSGGGAKGFAHLGIYKALQEAGIPIDMVCGTSMGSLVAAAIAHEWPAEELLNIGRNAFVVDKPLNDYTLPMISLIKGHKLQKINKKYFGDLHVENLWLNFFCVSGNYTKSRMEVHETGPLWKAVTASIAIPGVLPPVVKDNDLLVDGGVYNNFPVDIMKQRYGGKLMGVDLLADKEYMLNYTQLPGGWPIFLSKFFPFMKRYKAPNIASIIIKSISLGSIVHQRNQVHDLELLFSPPVAQFGFLDLKNYDTIVNAGYEYAKVYLKAVDVHQQLLEQEHTAVGAHAVAV